MSLSGASGFTFAAFSPTSDELVIARDSQSRALTWNLSDNQQEIVVQLPNGQGDSTLRASTAPGERIVYADDDIGRTIAVRDLRSGRTSRLGATPRHRGRAVSPDGRHVAAATAIGKLWIWQS